MKRLRAVIKSIFDRPFFYTVIRRIALFGDDKRPVVQALDMEDTDRILDVGCGAGDYAGIVRERGYYLGVDSHPDFIRAAKNRFTGKNIDFAAGDILKLDIPDKSFDKAILVFVMHHINDEGCERLLEKLSRVVKKRCVIVENINCRYHFINNLLCRLDRGEFIRPLEHQKRLIGRYFEIEGIKYYYARSFIKKRILFVCSPASR